jgi:hypothetical protein
MTTRFRITLFLIIVTLAFAIAIGITQEPYDEKRGFTALATQIYELHQDVYTLQTQVAKQDAR